MYKSRAVSAEVAEANAQIHLELEQKCLHALVEAMNVRTSVLLRQNFSDQHPLLTFSLV